MKAVEDKGPLKKQVKAKFKGNDPLKKYQYGQKYLLSVEDVDGAIQVSLATGGANITYNNIEHYKACWEEVEVKTQTKASYYLSLSYNDDGSPKLDHKNSGMREADIITALEIAKLHLIQEVTGGGQKNG